VNIKKPIKGVQLSDAVWVCQVHARDFSRPIEEADAEGPECSFCMTQTEPGHQCIGSPFVEMISGDTLGVRYLCLKCGAVVNDADTHKRECPELDAPTPYVRERQDSNAPEPNVRQVPVTIANPVQVTVIWIDGDCGVFVDDIFWLSCASDGSGNQIYHVGDVLNRLGRALGGVYFQVHEITLHESELRMLAYIKPDSSYIEWTWDDLEGDLQEGRLEIANRRLIIHPYEEDESEGVSGPHGEAYITPTHPRHWSQKALWLGAIEGPESKLRAFFGLGHIGISALSSGADKRANLDRFRSTCANRTFVLSFHSGAASKEREKDELSSDGERRSTEESLSILRGCLAADALGHLGIDPSMGKDRREPSRCAGARVHKHERRGAARRPGGQAPGETWLRDKVDKRHNGRLCGQ
jgi:hypothetical protein